jgi:hypothetical protein
MTTTYTPTENSTIEYGVDRLVRLASGNFAAVRYDGTVEGIYPEDDPFVADFPYAAAERTCIICDGLGHAYIIGWEVFDNGTSRPVTGGGPCPLEDRGWDDDPRGW